MEITKKNVALSQKLANNIWKTYSDEYGYRTEKLNKNKSVSPKILENIYFFVGQFDITNQQKMYVLAKEKGDKGAELAEWITENYLKPIYDIITPKDAQKAMNGMAENVKDKIMWGSFYKGKDLL